MLQTIKNHAFTIAVIEFLVIILLFVMYKKVTNPGESTVEEEK